MHVNALHCEGFYGKNIDEIYEILHCSMNSLHFYLKIGIMFKFLQIPQLLTVVEIMFPIDFFFPLNVLRFLVPRV